MAFCAGRGYGFTIETKTGLPQRNQAEIRGIDSILRPERFRALNIPNKVFFHASNIHSVMDGPQTYEKRVKSSSHPVCLQWRPHSVDRTGDLW
jgi:hypothetical protein